jgi:fructose-bisphosphate aldolase, class II
MNNKTLKEIFKEARSGKYAVGQFNFSSLEQLQGIVMAGEKTKTPLICGTSSGEADFFGMEEAVACVNALRKKNNTPVFLNLDHGRDVEEIKKAVDLGYDMVHFDGSKMSIEESTEKAKQVVAYAKEKNVVVEGEISEIKGSSTFSDKEIGKIELKDIEEIAFFVKETGVDCVALDVGNIHGVYKNKPEIHSERVVQLLEKINCFVVLHGGSGISDKDIRKVISSGVVKVNINTELRLAWKRAVEKKIKENPKEIVPYKILPSARDAVYKKVVEKITLFQEK